MTQPEHRFAMRTTVEDDRITVFVSGEFDAGAVSAFEAELKRIEADAVLVCLRDVTILDSSALGALMRRTTASRAADVELLLHAPKPYQVDLIEITGLASLLDLATCCSCEPK